MPTNEVLQACDLQALAGSLIQSTLRDRLLVALKRMRTVQSCLSDLALAQNTVDALGGLQNSANFESELLLTAAQHALVANAVILYARATSSGSKRGGRGSISIRDRLNPTDLADHDALIELRNKVLAHVHADEVVADSVWHKERSFAIREASSDAWTITCATRRKQVDELTLRRLETLIPTATETLTKTFQVRVGDTAKLMHELPMSEDLLMSHLIDVSSIYGSAAEAKRSWSMRQGGKTSGVIAD